MRRTINPLTSNTDACRRCHGVGWPTDGWCRVCDPGWECDSECIRLVVEGVCPRITYGHGRHDARGVLRWCKGEIPMSRRWPWFHWEWPSDSIPIHHDLSSCRSKHTEPSECVKHDIEHAIQPTSFSHGYSGSARVQWQPGCWFQPVVRKSAHRLSHRSVDLRAVASSANSGETNPHELLDRQRQSNIPGGSNLCRSMFVAPPGQCHYVVDLRHSK